MEVTEPGIKIKAYKIRANGIRGSVLSLPSVWVQDVGLKAGDLVNVYRTGDDRLILEVVRPAVSL